MKLIYKIEMLSDWHCGTGLTEGADVDLICIKDDNGLPFIPGKTLKGLIKEAARYYESNDKSNQWKDFIKKYFGIATDRNNEKETEQGKLYFSNAYLSKNVIDAIRDKNNSIDKSVLFRTISSTAIDDNGIAMEHSLRKIEVAIPLTLYAEIDNLDNEEDKNKMIKCFKLVKRLGTNRNRGLGRCKLEEVNNE